jgi:nucleoside-specific outer membrane channel protein Tsx
MMVLSGISHAVQWQDNSISYSTSNQFTEPGVSQKVSKHIVEYVHVNGYRLANNLFRAKVMRSDSNDPAESGDKGATEVYVVYRHLLSLGAVTGKSFAFGPVRDVGLTAGFDLNTKNNAFSPRKRLLVAGPTLRFDVPRGSQLDFSLLAAKEYNHCGLPPCKAPGAKEDIAFDLFPLLHLAWRLPFQMGSTNIRFEGFAAKGFRQGTDYVGNPVAYETLVRAALLADIGQPLLDRKNTLFAGLGYEFWRNKYGANGVPGIDTDAPTLHLKWHF